MSALQGKDILVVDDEADIRLLARKILEGDGAIVVDCPDIATALTSAQKKVPHLILTDLTMPGGSGFDLLAKKRQIPELQTVPVIVLSGMKDRDSVSRAIALG